MIDESYIRTSEVTVQDVLYNTLYNMSFLLRDNLGKMREKDVGTLLKALRVSSSGDVIGLGGDLPLTNDVLLGKEEFYPALSQRAFRIHNTLMHNNSPYVSSEMVVWEEDSSALFQHLEGLPDYASSYMSYLYLELYALVTSVVEYNPGEILDTTIPEIDVLVSNARYISAVLGNMGNQENTYELLNVLKHVQRSILFVRKGILSIQR